MKRSIQKQMAFWFIGLMSIILLGNWLINNIFLESYYVMKKKNSLIKTYNIINQVKDAEEYQSEEFHEQLENIRDTTNIVNLVILNEDFQRIWSMNLSKDRDWLAAKLWAYYNILGFDDSDVKILVENGDYTVQKYRDISGEMDNLEIWGMLDTGYYIAMSIPVNSIRENVKISNEFLGYFSIIGITFSIILIWWISKQITKPILELANLSKRMASLDFDAKYNSGGENEIGQLGSHFNKMSITLQNTISELKTANNELQKDIEQKIQIDEMRKEFLSNVSHELKTPIALIQGYAEGLKECINEDEESRDFYCDVIMDEASKMNLMVKKLLTLNQLEFGNETVSMERFDITSLVGGVIQSVDLLAQQKDARIIYEEDKPVYVWADEFKIEEVITNYISNAINHVDFDKVIDVKVQRLNEKVRISVFNTGLPIPAEELDKIWIKFYKVDKARTREYGGSGIGLSIVKAIMESLNQGCGVINYENGVEFWFELDGEENSSTGDE